MLRYRHRPGLSFHTLDTRRERPSAARIRIKTNAYRHRPVPIIDPWAAGDRRQTTKNECPDWNQRNLFAFFAFFAWVLVPFGLFLGGRHGRAKSAGISAIYTVGPMNLRR